MIFVKNTKKIINATEKDFSELVKQLKKTTKLAKWGVIAAVNGYECLFRKSHIGEESSDIYELCLMTDDSPSEQKIIAATLIDKSIYDELVCKEVSCTGYRTAGVTPYKDTAELLKMLNQMIIAMR